ncbi:Peptidase A1 [Corchorus olitorius]|uniref:Peptidase A1 n=1 Tax=Corchorus olitorius TaxID=93759 RepID=A0A1R3KA93_9ROSI|nr:Peptidase A1 [Corchorus olitorius]
MDTGSSLLWVQSRPCQFPQCLNLSPRYDYTKSSTYTPLPCSSEYCNFDQQPKNIMCTNFVPCFYKTTYVQSVDSRGHLATEQLMFRTSDGGMSVIENVVIGCGRPKRKLEMEGQIMTGVFGLGFKKTSLARRLAKFSYCVGNVKDPNYGYNKLILGEEARTEGESTPLYLINDFYHVILEGISVGETRLSIDPNAFQWNGEEETGVIIDSGSPATWLIKEFYDPILQQVQSLGDTFLTRIPKEKPYLVCYKGTIEQELEGFPTITFHFAGGAELVLDTKSSFYQEQPDEFCLAFLPSYAKTGIATRLVIKLVHRDSIHSPYYNKNDNVTVRVKRAMESSVLRFTYLQNKVRRTLPDNDLQAEILPSTDSSVFFMNISIGQPPIPQFTVMDTGSSLLWVQCLPCKHCSKQFGPIFDPEKSSTYFSLSCNSQYCHYAPHGRCNFLNQCVYNQTYIHGRPSVGILAEEQLIFKTSDEGSAAIPNVIFGCSHENGNFKDHQISGVIGLGSRKLSLITQFDSKFSYCVGSIFDPYYGHNKLILGNGAFIEGDYTPLEVIDGQYYVTMEGISVGEKRLDIDSNTFRRNKWKKSGVMIDSGSATTWLVRDGFEALRDEVQSLLGMWLTRYWYNSWALCYRGMINEDLIGFPVVTFHFAGGADLVLDTGSLFVQLEPYAFCMNVLPSESSGDNITNLSLIGMLAQQNYNIAYDISGKKMSFQRIDCQLLEE